jgi:acetate---CoA ligase (ADP-forming)
VSAVEVAGLERAGHAVRAGAVPGLRDSLFAPRRLLVVGASNDPGKFSGRPIAYLRRSGFDGEVIPVNPGRATVQGYPAISSVGQLQGQAELAIIAVAAPQVAEALESCAAVGVGAAIVFASGFAESGPAGSALQAEIAELVKRTGLRVLGPNCLGLLSLQHGLAATFSSGLQQQAALRTGPIALVSQSGAFGTFLFSAMQAAGIGLNYFANTGNEVDLTAAELLEILVEEEDVHVLLAYLEGVKDAARLLAAGRRAAELGKPIVLVKVGRTEAGSRAAVSHSGSLAVSDDVFEAAMEQVGILRVEGPENLIDAARVFLPRRTAGRDGRLSIVTISGGGGILAADTASDAGLDVVPWDDQWRRRMAAILPPYAATGNPVDLTDLEPLGASLAVVGEHPATDLGLVVLGNSEAFETELVQTIRTAYQATERPLAVSWTGGSGNPVRSLTEAGIPVYTDPCRAVRALALVARHARLLAVSQGQAGGTVQAARRESAGAIIDNALARGGTLGFDDSAALLRLYGIAVPQFRIVASAAAAVDAARAIGLPVAVKLEAAQVAHKSDIGAVYLHLAADGEVRAAASAVLRAGLDAGAAEPRVLVQAMVPPGLELIVGMVRDRVFGPVIVCGLGGVMTEVLADRVLLCPPFGADLARQSLYGLRGARLLDGYRSLPSRDVESAVASVVGIGELTAEIGDRIAEIDLNPLVLGAAGEGAQAADALILLSDGSS